MVLEKFDVVIYSLIELNKAPAGSAKGTILLISGIILVQKVEFLAVYSPLKRGPILRLNNVPFCVQHKGTI